MEIKNIKIGCIGTGVMGGALMEAMAKKFGGDKIFVYDVDSSKAQAFAKKIGGTALTSSVSLATNVDVLFLAVKPAFVSSVIEKFGSHFIDIDFSKRPLVVSIAAGVTLARLKECLGGNNFNWVRVMPNLPATVGEAMIALSPDENTSEEETELVKTLLESAGRAEVVPEKLMDAVTAISGSGPAYVFMFIEALADAAVRFGMPRKQAYIYAAQTLRGSATLFLEDGRSVSELKDAVCSPAGTTIEAVASLEQNGFRSAIIQASTAAFKKSIELGKK